MRDYDSYCDWCSNHKPDCKYFHGCTVCKDCRKDYKHARELIAKAAMGKMVRKLVDRGAIC